MDRWQGFKLAACFPSLPELHISSTPTMITKQREIQPADVRKSDCKFQLVGTEEATRKSCRRQSVFIVFSDLTVVINLGIC
jgi:hypothetical protein